MAETVSKSQLKKKTLEYLTKVEETGEPLIITEHGKAVLKIEPNVTGEQTLRLLRGCVVRFDMPTEPVGFQDWKSVG